LSDERDFASLYKNNWLTCGIIQDFLEAIFYDMKDRDITTPCYLIHNTFYHFLTINDEYTYSPSHTRHLNKLHFEGDLAFLVHVPGHWLIAVISFLNKQIIVLDPIDTQRYSTKIAENLKLFVIDEYENARKAYDMNEWKIITQCPNISMQTNYYSCGIFASVRLQYWCIYRRFPTPAEFSQKDDAGFRLYMVKRILQFHSILLNKSKGSSSHLHLMNKRKIIVHTLTEDERNNGIDLTTDEIDAYLL
jgi:Ulp1 family protease